MPTDSRQRQTRAAVVVAACVAVTVMFQLYALLLQNVVVTATEGGIRIQQAMTYSSTPFDFDSIDDEDAIFRFRFSKELIYLILPYLRLDLIQWSSRYRPTPLAAFCILLRRLSYPERWGSMMNDFGRSRSYLCSVTRDVVWHLIRRYKAKLEWDGGRTNACQRFAICKRCTAKVRLLQYLGLH
ncbi:uncharacterized protein V1513DRAFT_276884 [Lipomyces chichibuensis]|uniref:uncharacterized protein n=1 Tax=Lipomyces chichibuensis TaxID=1546026 RepID=UPI0033430D0E